MKVHDFNLMQGAHWKAGELHKDGKLAIIESVLEKDFKGNDGSIDRRPVVHFVGMEKGLVLNVVNTNTIMEICQSDDTDDWQGISIVFYPTKTEFSGRMVDCIRVREPKPGSGPANANAKVIESRKGRDHQASVEASGPTEPEDDIPF